MKPITDDTILRTSFSVPIEATSSVRSVLPCALLVELSMSELMEAIAAEGPGVLRAPQLLRRGSLACW
jgi:hypothetical protein